MRDIAERYRQENGTRLIDISLNRIQQLFNSLDPSPFHEKDLDAEAEAYIVGAAREFHIGTPLKLVFHFPDSEADAAQAVDLGASIRSYFTYRRDSARRDLRFLLRQGRLTLAIGLAFLAACLSLRAVLLLPSASALNNIVAEGLVITGWVAMWRPIQIFLYDWWPLRGMVRIYEKLAQIPVEIRPTGTPTAAARAHSQPALT
jgi:hypothetical protein